MTLPAEIRSEILKLLLPDLHIIPFRVESARLRPRSAQSVKSPEAAATADSTSPQRAEAVSSSFRRRGIVETYTPLRTDRQSCHVAVARTCQQLHHECRAIIFCANRMFIARLDVGRVRDLALFRCWNLGLLQHTLSSQDDNTDNSFEHFSAMLRDVKSLCLVLPLFEHCYWPVRSAVHTFVKLLLRVCKPSHGNCGVRKLVIDIEPGRPSEPTSQEQRMGIAPGYPLYTNSRRNWDKISSSLVERQVTIKWVLAPLQHLCGPGLSSFTVLLRDRGEDSSSKWLQGAH